MTSVLVRMSERHSAIVFLGPALAIIAVFVLLPFVVALGLSLTDYSPALAGRGSFIGLKNYQEAFGDSAFRGSVWFSVRFAAAAVMIEVVAGAAVALWLTSLRRPLRVIPLLMIPSLVPPVTVALTWKYIFQPDFGVGSFLAASLLRVQDLTMTSDPGSAFWFLVAVDVWQWTPLVAVILFAGISSVPRNSIEASQLDGASRLRTVLSVVLPAVSPFLAVAAVLRLIDGFRLFDSVYVLTGGGPGASTEAVNLYLWRISFKFWETGYGAALAILSYLVTLAALCLIFSRLRRVLRWQ